MKGIKDMSPYKIKTPLGYPNDRVEVIVVNNVIDAMWPTLIKKAHPHHVHEAAYSILESDEFESLYWELYQKRRSQINQGIARKIRQVAIKTGFIPGTNPSIKKV